MKYLLIIRRYAPFATFGGGFEGDTRRTATDSQYASARTIGFVQFDENGGLDTYGVSSGSKFDGFGTWLSSKVGTHYAKVKSSISNVKRNCGVLSFSVHTEGSNPLVPIVSPDIDTLVDVSIKFGKTSLMIKGVVNGDSFPNCEILIVDAGMECSLNSNPGILRHLRSAPQQKHIRLQHPRHQQRGSVDQSFVRDFGAQLQHEL